MIRTSIFLLGLFGLQVFLGAIIKWWLGDLFLALGFVLVTETQRKFSRLILLLFLGLWEGYFQGSGLLGGFISALLTFAWQELMVRNLDLSSFGSLLVYAISSLVVFNLLLLVIFPYLLEENFFPHWFLPFIIQNLFISGEMIAIIVWRRRENLKQAYLS